jgi:hypothetical protein
VSPLSWGLGQTHFLPSPGHPALLMARGLAWTAALRWTLWSGQRVIQPEATEPALLWQSHAVDCAILFPQGP